MTVALVAGALSACQSQSQSQSQSSREPGSAGFRVPLDEGEEFVSAGIVAPVSTDGRPQEVLLFRAP